MLHRSAAPHAPTPRCTNERKRRLAEGDRLIRYFFADAETLAELAASGRLALEDVDNDERLGAAINGNLSELPELDARIAELEARERRLGAGIERLVLNCRYRKTGGGCSQIECVCRPVLYDWTGPVE